MKRNAEQLFGGSLRAQTAAAAIGLVAAVGLLVFVLVFSEICLTKLENRVMPLIDAAIGAAGAGDTEKANALGTVIDRELRDAEGTLMLIAGHRDLMEMLRASGEVVALGAHADPDSYISALGTVRTCFRLILENNDLSVGNIL